ncbi:Hypothetical predicted protein [Olea europaea subsp. europaea]|uniref:Uncharacterized protein n=1 Tax=Olea europaea subsp. europaea TaxID=158383 RepID=A0A8S0SLI6_OLEEU|nr:Hypothetical predicted protein [Olea europaea subsp. europaea]
METFVQKELSCSLKGIADKSRIRVHPNIFLGINEASVSGGHGGCDAKSTRSVLDNRVVLGSASSAAAKTRFSDENMFKEYNQEQSFLSGCNLVNQMNGSPTEGSYVPLNFLESFPRFKMLKSKFVSAEAIYLEKSRRISGQFESEARTPSILNVSNKAILSGSGRARMAEDQSEYSKSYPKRFQ